MVEPVDIAIVGMAGLFPKAPSASEFWSNILNKVDAVGEPPEGWLGEPKLFDPEAPLDELRLYTLRGGFLGDLSRFDPRPFGAMPISVIGGEPDQFLALKCAQAALEDAGLGADVDFPRERTGCVLGHAIHANRANVNGFQHGLVIDQVMQVVSSLFPESSPAERKAFEKTLRGKLPKFGVDTMPALIPNMMTGRICNRLDLMGPNYIMDAACASTTLAIETAVSELRRGRADVMLAGGVNTTTSTLVFGVFCQLGALSRTARIRPFSRGGDGTLLGEGQGIFVLKRLEDALKAEDRIYAVIKSIGVSSDGRSSGLMAPRLEGEALAMRRAYEHGGIDPSSVDLIEAHGTGIPLGDRTEIDAMRQIFGERRRKYPDVALGSVKSMIGHCIPAAGAASIIKTSFALFEKILPPTLCDEVNPELGLDASPFYVNTETRPWLRDPATPRRAAVNAFGFGGVNSHLVLEESPVAETDSGAAFGVRRRQAPELFCWASASRESLIARIDAAKAAAVAQAVEFGRYADELAQEEENGDFRLAIMADGWQDLAAKLDTVRNKIPSSETFTSRNGISFHTRPVEGKIAFLFPGEHSQYAGMLEALAVNSPVVRRWLDRLEGLFGAARELPHRHLLYPPPTGLAQADKDAAVNRLAEIAEGSEAVFFADTAYFRLLSALGIKADFMLGHSTGENAAIISSALVEMSDDDISAYIRAMNVIFSRVEKDGSVPTGVLLSVGAVDAAEIDAILAEFSDVHLTMDNCPNQKILFGDEARMTEIAARLAGQGAICARLPLSWAYHTEFVRPLADEFADLFGSARMGERTAKLYSCSTAEPFPAGEVEARDIIVRQYVTRVRFADAIRRMYADGARVFIEVGAENSLSGFVRDTLGGQPHLALACDNPRRDAFSALLFMLGQLFSCGRFDARRMAPERVTSAHVAKEPFLPSMLPLIHLSPDEGNKARAALGGGGAAAASTQPPVAALPVQPQPSGPPASRAQQPEVSLQDFTSQIGETFGARMVLARLSRPFQSVEEWAAAARAGLTAAEIEGPAASIIARSPARRQEWLLGRLAAKRAIGMLMNGAGSTASILMDSEGRPLVRMDGAGAAPFISITHKDGFAIAAAAHQPIGVDVENLAVLRDAALFAERVLTDDERAFMDSSDDADSAVVVLWSLKEAAAKALGALFVGQERAFCVDAINPGARRARVLFEDRSAELAYVISGGFVCAIGAASAI